MIVAVAVVVMFVMRVYAVVSMFGVSDVHVYVMQVILLTYAGCMYDHAMVVALFVCLIYTCDMKLQVCHVRMCSCKYVVNCMAACWRRHVTDVMYVEYSSCHTS